MELMDTATSDARLRKNRIKNKMGTYLFEQVFIVDNLARYSRFLTNYFHIDKRLLPLLPYKNRFFLVYLCHLGAEIFKPNLL